MIAMRYQKILSRIWYNDKFSSLDASAQRLYLYILTCPHGNLIGCFVLKEGYACADLEVLPKDFHKDLAKLIEKGLVKYCISHHLVLIPTFLKHNPLTNPNQKKAAIKILQDLPKCELLLHFKGLLEGFPEGLSEVLLKPENRNRRQKAETETEVSAPVPPDRKDFEKPPEPSDAHPPTADASADLRAAPEQPQEIPVFRCKHFEITRDYLNALREDYPALNEEQLLLEIKKAADYAADNNGRFKRRANGQLKNPRLFLRNWLNRVVVPPNQARAPTPGQSKSDRNIAVAQAWAAKKKREMSSDD